MSKALAKQEKTALPAEYEADLLADAEEFQEHLSKEDLSIPFLQVLQPMSPQVDEGSSACLPYATKGQLFNSVSKKVYDGKTEGLQIVPVHYKRSFIEWIPRTQGGGFVNEYAAELGATAITARNDNNEDVIQVGSPIGTPGNQLVETATHIVVMIDPETGDPSPCILSMAVTQMKVSRNWNSQIDARKVTTANGRVKPPRFWDVWRLKSVINTNDSGSWYLYDLTNEGETKALPNGQEIYDACKELRRGITSGEAKADYSKMNERTEGASGEDDLPF